MASPMPFSVSSPEGFSSTVPGLSYPKMVEQLDPDKPASPKDGAEAKSKTPKERGKKASKVYCYKMGALPPLLGNLTSMYIGSGIVVLYRRYMYDRGRSLVPYNLLILVYP